MSKSYRIRTEIGKDKFLQVKLDQDYDKLELLSLAIFPNDVYTRDCAEFGVLCGRVFSNRGLGIENARVSIFIPLQSEDEQNPIISTLYPYKTFEQFNEDGYKYNLLPYTQSHSGHVPVGTFPERSDALTNKSVIEVYDKYYKFTAKTNSAGDYMIFGLPIGQHEMFMQVDLSDIGEFSLTPQDLIRSGRATEAQIDGTNFKFSENYSELPQIVTLTKTIQIAPFYGQKEVCDYYITRADFDLTLEAFIEIQPTSVFMGSIISTQERRKLKQNCKVPPKQGWLCDLVTGRGMIETIRQTVNIGSDGRPILETFTLEKDGKVIDENGAWLVELPMNLDYVYTDEFGVRQISPDGSKGVPTKGKYRFKVKWNQSTFLSEENKRGYFLVPNIKEWGWTNSNDDPTPSLSTTSFEVELETNENERDLSYGEYFVFEKSINVEEYKIYSSIDDGETFVERPEFQTIIPFPDLIATYSNIIIKVVYTLIDSSNPLNPGILYYRTYNDQKFQQLSSYAFSLNWLEYGTTDMISEALSCEDRFYNFEYNKVYTVSSFIDRYTSKGINLYLPQRTIQIKNITDNSCEGSYNKFPTNDAYYRYDVVFIIISALLTFFKFVFVPLVIVLHFLAFIWPILKVLLWIVNLIYGLIVAICKGINAVSRLLGFSINCPEWQWESYSDNPFKNVKLPLLLSSEDGCSLCKCNIGDVNLQDNEYSAALARFVGQIEVRNTSNLVNLTTASSYAFMGGYAYNHILNEESPYFNWWDHVELTGGGKEWDALDYAVFAAGNAVNDLHAKKIGHFRLPILAWGDGDPNDASTERYFDRFSIGVSTHLTLAERLNLFNTKAKYFDRDPADTFRNSLNGGSISPGDIGWNQIKVQFFSNIPTNSSTYHYDNIMLLLVDATGVTVGDVYAFQNPRDSEDPNYKYALGKLVLPNSDETFEVKYANPTYGEGNSSAYYYAQYVPSGGDVGESIIYTASTGTTCFPADLEYYQVIHVESRQTYKTKRNALNPTGNNRYSLAWRFLDSDHISQSVGADYKTGYRGDDPAVGVGGELNWPAGDRGSFFQNLPEEAPINNPPDYFNNAMMFMRIMNPPYGPGYDGYLGWGDTYAHCFNKQNHPILSIFDQTDAEAGFVGDLSHLGPTKSPYWNVWSNLTGVTNVVFLVRGVDVHSGKYPVKYDLSRLYGYETYGQPGLQVDGNFFLNIPIQAWNDYTPPYGSLPGSPNRNGLKLPIHSRFSSNNPDLTDRGGSIFYRPYFFRYFTASSPEVINDTEDLVPPYDGDWKTTNHLFYSALDTQLAENTYALNGQGPGQGWSHSGVTQLWGPMNRVYYTDDIVVSDTANYFGVSWHRRTLGDFYNGTNNLPSNCGGENQFFPNDIKEVAYYCENFGNGSDTGKPRLNMAPDSDNLSSQIYGTFFSTVSSPNYTQPMRQSSENDEGFTTTRNGWVGARDWYVSCDPVWGPQTIPNGGAANWCRQNRAFPGRQGVLPGVWYDGSVQQVDGNASTWFRDTDKHSCFYLANKGYRTKYQWVFHGHRDNYEMNHVGGLFHGEYVEGGSVMCASFDREHWAIGMYSFPYGGSLNTGLYVQPRSRTNGSNAFACGGVAYNDSYFTGNDLYGGTTTSDGGFIPGAWGDSTCWAPFNMFYSLNKAGTFYVSTVYSEMKNADTPDQCYIAIDSINPTTGQYNLPQGLDMSDSTGLVFRSDRLPSSDRPNGFDELKGSGYLIHQNPGFRIFTFSNTQGTICPQFSGFGGGSIALNVATNEPDNTLVEDNPNLNSDVLESTVDCAKAVDLNSYTINAGKPEILDAGPWSKDGKYIWFQRREGCYNTVSRPILSMLAQTHSDPYTGVQKKYSDIISVVEWVQRIKLTLAACFDIFSHTFSNNWVNGTLYAFPFQLSTRYDANNLPTSRRYCSDVVYFNDTTNNFFYRASPYNSTTSKFIGKQSLDSPSQDNGGNVKNLLYPVTVIDLGPKNQYIQELVNSDVYDGYIADKIPSTTYQNVETFLNVFILSRLINSTFMQLLIPSAKFEGGNDAEGNDDPSVGAFFQNKRWSNGSLFKPGGAIPFPGLIDGDYAQMISINSEIGILEFDPGNYKNSDVFLGIQGTNSLTDYPWFGVILSGDNQWRDYITPRRKFYSENGDLTNLSQFSTQIPGVNFQTVPFYLWNDIFGDSNSIFGHQNNNFATNDSDFQDIGYQEADRLFSRYFKPEDNYTKTHKGYIAKYITTTNINGEIELIPNESVPSGSAIYTINNDGKIMVGAPFHFYFGLIKGSSAMDLFINKYVDTTVVNG
jgi:hypothetical protein